jgi:hypothetical protein
MADSALNTLGLSLLFLSETYVYLKENKEILLSLLSYGIVHILG